MKLRIKPSTKQQRDILKVTWEWYCSVRGGWDYSEEPYFKAVDLRLWFKETLTPKVKESIMPMKYASAHYIANPNPEIYVFVDEEPSGLPDGIAEICSSTDVDQFLDLLEPYFILAKDK